jgi:hypothetical protein
MEWLKEFSVIFARAVFLSTCYEAGSIPQTEGSENTALSG